MTYSRQSLLSHQKFNLLRLNPKTTSTSSHLSVLHKMEESKATEPFLSSYSSDHEDASTDPEAYCEYDSSKRKVRFPWKYFKYPGLVFLSLGWLVAAGLALQPVHMYTTAIHNSPLPRELFQTVKRSFHMDERYVGPSESANDNWEALIAGTYNEPPFYFMNFLIAS